MNHVAQAAVIFFICTLSALIQAGAPATTTRRVASFETDSDNPFFSVNNLDVARVTEHATHGVYALRLKAKGFETPTWPGLALRPVAAESNWSERQLLVMDLFLETPESVECGAQLSLEGRRENLTLPMRRLLPGWNKGLTLCLEDFDVDRSRVTSLVLYFARPKKDVVCTIDNVCWETLPAATEFNGWTNAREFGASGSKFETLAVTLAGSNQIVVAEVGDFQVGQQISVSKCNVHYLRPTRYGPGGPYGTARPLGDALELRGYDGSGGSWLVYIVEIDGCNPVTFRWKGDLARPWAAMKVPVTYDWQTLSKGTDIRFKREAWKPGEMITFSARDQLSATIDRIEGRVLTLSEHVNRSTTNAVVRHTDQAAIQKALDVAHRQKRNVFFPAGHYRIPGGLRVTKPTAISLEGANAETTVLDISDGEGSCIALSGGTEATIRNFTMIGHTGLAEAPLAFTTSSGHGFWPNGLKGCNAVGMTGTERVLIENVHARRMANECFYAQGPSRSGSVEPQQYQKSLTYLRCSVTDCAANAFNNNDCGENTSVLYCRVDGAGGSGWHALEMPARFLRVNGCYFRNTGPITVGDMSHRSAHLNELGCGQAMIRDNVFEGVGGCGGIRVNHGSSQITISGNLFINFNGPAIVISSETVRPDLSWFKPGEPAPTSRSSFPSHSAMISGNIIDMTYPGTNTDARTRVGINVSASNVTVADNQVYVRGSCDAHVTGIRLSEPALHVTIHNNLIRNCGSGLVTGRARSHVTAVIDSLSFLESSLPLEWSYSHCYEGWNVVWFSKGITNGTSVIESFDPLTLCFKLTAPREIKVGEAFEVFPAHSANWLIHDNIITGCQQPVVLDSYGSKTSIFKDNLISRGGNAGATQAIQTVRGQFQLDGNRINGFEEEK